MQHPESQQTLHDTFSAHASTSSNLLSEVPPHRTLTNMLPEEVVGRYRRYKRGTRKLVSWLVKMVSDFGDIESIIVTLPSSPKANQARQRQQRKKQGKKAKKRQIALEPAELEVSSRQLVELAEAVACIDPPALIPDYILTTVGDVIKGRGECHDWYSGQASSTSTTADSDNETHQYFIGVSSERRSISEL